MSWGQWGAWQVHPRVVVGWDGRSSIGPAAGGEECREKEAKGRKVAEQRENEMRWLEESGRELGLGIALICDEAACWFSGWQTLLWILVVMGQSVYSSKKTIFLGQDFLLCRESLQATKKVFPFPFFSFSSSFALAIAFLLLSSFTFFLLSFSFLVCFLPCTLSPGISSDGCIEILRQGKCVCALCNHFCQKDWWTCANEERLRNYFDSVPQIS